MHLEERRRESLVQMELEGINSCEFDLENSAIEEIANNLADIVKEQPVVTLGKSYSVTDAFLTRAKLPKSNSQQPELNSLLYKDNNPNWERLAEVSQQLPAEPFVIVDEFSFSGTKMMTTIIRLLRLGIENFQFVALLGSENSSLEEAINNMEQFLNQEDRDYLGEHRDKVVSRMKVLKRKKSLLKKLGTFTNIISNYQNELNNDTVQSSIFSDKRIEKAILEKLSQITKPA